MNLKIPTVEDCFQIMKKNFDKELAGELKKKLVAQLIVEGEGGGKWHVIIDNQEIQFLKGEAENPRITITYDSVKSFYQIVLGEIDGVQAYTMGKVKVEGPRAVLTQYAAIVGIM